MGRGWGRENQRWRRADRAALVAGALHKGVDERGVGNEAGKGGAGRGEAEGEGGAQGRRDGHARRDLELCDGAVGLEQGRGVWHLAADAHVAPGLGTGGHCREGSGPAGAGKAAGLFTWCGVWQGPTSNCEWAGCWFVHVGTGMAGEGTPERGSRAQGISVRHAAACFGAAACIDAEACLDLCALQFEGWLLVAVAVAAGSICLTQQEAFRNCSQGSIVGSPTGLSHGALTGLDLDALQRAGQVRVACGAGIGARVGDDGEGDVLTACHGGGLNRDGEGAAAALVVLQAAHGSVLCQAHKRAVSVGVVNGLLVLAIGGLQD